MTTYRKDMQRAWDRINSVAAGRLQTGSARSNMR